MAFQSYVGSFAKRAGTGSQAITGFGFPPKVVIFTSSGAFASGFVTGDAIISHGFDDGVTACCTASINKNARVAADAFTSNGVFTVLMSVVVPMKAFPALIDCEGRITSMDVNGFTFNWNLSTSAYTGMIVSYVALGGSTLEAKVGYAQDDSAGLQSVTGVGFEPEVVHLMHGRGASGDQSFGNVFYLNTGWMNSLGCQHSFNLHAQADPEVAYFEQLTNRCIAPIDSVVTRDARYVSMDADGFTIEWLHVDTAGKLAYLALGGIDSAVGAFPQPDEAWRWRISNTGLTPSLVSLSSIGQPASPSRQDGTAIAIGSFTDTATVCDWTSCPPSTPLVTASYHSALSAVIAATAATPGADSVLTMEGSAGRMGTDGFDLTFNPINPQPLQILYVALGTRTSTPDTPCVPTVTKAPAPVGVTRVCRRVRRFPLPYANKKTVFLQRIEFLQQPGIGTISGQGADPVAMIRISRDGGITWGPEFQLSPGKMGDYVQRMFRHRLGRYRDGVCELVVTDPNPWAFIGCDVQLEEGTS